MHGGLGMFLSSKSIQSSKRFNVPIQAGAEIPFGRFSAVIDLTLFKAFSGVGLQNIVSGGVRYDISSRTRLNAVVSSAGGFLMRLTMGGSGRTAAVASQATPSLF